jgi:AraC family transcriptional regulator
LVGIRDGAEGVGRPRESPRIDTSVVEADRKCGRWRDRCAWPALGGACDNIRERYHQAGGRRPSADQRGVPLNAESRVTRTVRTIHRHPGAALTLGQMARQTGLSPYYFLRTFERVAGLTPNQYVRRARLREAATRLVAESSKVIDVALDCGFTDISNFNRAFRTEFGLSPRKFRQIASVQTPVDRHDPPSN